ncbi:Frag1/DRAM/Sfk1 family-domain-containing protein [Amylostereum chailletii]|nr:Frag1/DRAM/Sfk1 family-domain-containing protein [Amylostereum chailletii]
MATPSVVTVRASSIALLHTTLSFAAFLGALFVGCRLHYKKIVKNDVAGWPQEWFPSVSATIGDWYPERNLFQFLIAVNSGPRFAVLLLSYLLSRKLYPIRSTILLFTGLVRTVSCGGWVFVTSSDNHNVHDFFMILYIVCNLPWMWGGLYAGGRKAVRWRALYASAFWLSLFPMLFFFIEHKARRKPGAYTRYALFEWSLIFLDILYDSTIISHFKESDFQITLGLPTATSLEEKAESHDLDTVTKPVSLDVPSKPAVEIEATIRPPGSLVGTFNYTRPVLSFLSDVYFAYQSWTLLTALPTTLFYFSVWELALAGPELATLAALSPFLLGITSLYQAARTHNVGLGLWGVKSVWGRLGAVVVGVMSSTLKWALEWEDHRTGYYSVVFLLGLLTSSLSKHLNDGNNPGSHVFSWTSY